jgi:hypothetical protein
LRINVKRRRRRSTGSTVRTTSDINSLEKTDPHSRKG